jgi:hypothetical protein
LRNKGLVILKLAIMQPYLFPYLGYFQLLHATDAFVIHDDVQYIKGGWINRNRILVEGKEHLFTFGVRNDASHLPINRREFADSFPEDKAKLLRLLRNVYRKASQFAPVCSLLEEIFSCEERNVAQFTTHAIKRMCGYLGIELPMVLSSQLDKNNALKAQERVIDIAARMKADRYINPIGGLELYSKAAFAARGITLNFLKPILDGYPQGGAPFVAGLSIIDVCMFNDRERIKELLDHYDLI